MKRLSVSICALLVCLNMSACDVVQDNTPTPQCRNYIQRACFRCLSHTD